MALTGRGHAHPVPSRQRLPESVVRPWNRPGQHAGTAGRCWPCQHHSLLLCSSRMTWPAPRQLSVSEALMKMSPSAEARQFYNMQMYFS